MLQDVLTSDSGFVEDVEVSITNTFTDIEPLYSNPNTHSRLFTATLRGKRFVLKALKEEYGAHPSYRELLNKEFEIGYPLSHPNIAATLGMHNVKGIGEVIAIEYVDGITLAEALDEDSVTADMARSIIAEICDAMHYMHSLQVIHRDLKPENIMLTHNGNHVKIIDFGLADSDAHTIFKQPAGTRRYASPELIEGQKIDNRSDIYSLGVIIESMFHNRRARKIVQRCMAVEREARFVDALEVKRELLRPSRKALYLGVVMALVAVVSIAIVAYNIGVRSTSAMRATEERVAQAIEAINGEDDVYQDVVSDVGGAIDSMLSNYYSRLPRIATHSELTDYCDEYPLLIEQIYSLAEERLAAKMDTLSTSYITYQSLLRQYVWHKIDEYYRLYEGALSEVIARVILI